jgi:predicted MFS family arabinose efflux permease
MTRQLGFAPRWRYIAWLRGSKRATSRPLLVRTLSQLYADVCGCSCWLLWGRNAVLGCCIGCRGPTPSVTGDLVRWGYVVRDACSVRVRQGVLTERNFRLFIIGYATSLTGAAMVPVALTFAVLQEGRGTADVGYVLAAEAVALVALVLIGGVLADRISRRVVMIGSDAARCASELLLAGLLLTGSPPLWVFLVLAGVLGAGQAFFNPALTGLLPLVSSPGRLQQANALNGVASSIAQIAGPAAAGLIVAAAGAGWAIALDGITYAVSAVCLVLVRIPAPLPYRGESFAAQLRAGWTEFRSRTWLWVGVGQFSLFNVLTYAPFMVLGAVIAKQALGGAAAWGIILAAQGAGSIIGGLVVMRMRPRRPLAVAMAGMAVFAGPAALLAVGASAAAVAAAAAVAGVGLAVCDTLWGTTLQQQVPSPVLSRVSAYDWFGSIAFVPLGYALAGPLSATIGVVATMWLAAGWAVTGAAGSLAFRSVRHMRALPDKAHSTGAVPAVNL